MALVPFLVGRNVDHRRLPTETGVVDQHVQPAQPRGGRGSAHRPARWRSRREPHSPPGPGPGSPAARASRRGGAHDDQGRRRRLLRAARPARGRRTDPVPAAAVTTTTLPVRSPCPRSLREPVPGRSSLYLSRQAEHSLGEDVALDLVRSAVDGVGARNRNSRCHSLKSWDSPSRNGPPCQYVHGRLAGPPMPVAHNNFEMLSWPGFSTSMVARGVRPHGSQPDPGRVSRSRISGSSMLPFVAGQRHVPESSRITDLLASVKPALEGRRAHGNPPAIAGCADHQDRRRYGRRRRTPR